MKIKRKNRPHPTIAHMGIDRGWNMVREPQEERLWEVMRSFFKEQRWEIQVSKLMRAAA